MTISSLFRGGGVGLFLSLLLLSGCCLRLQKATPGPGGVNLGLLPMNDKTERLRCGYYAARQVSQYYHAADSKFHFRTDSLLFDKANDTISILHCLKDNISIPMAMTNAEIHDVLNSVALGDPVVVFLPGDAFSIRSLNFIGPSLLHCIVIVGHNATQTELFFFSDGKGPYVIDRDKFAHQWARVENLCIMRSR
jgi:hypothetical protein